VLPPAARRLAETLPQLNALNTAGKSQADAAEALGVSVGAVRTWIALANLSWSNINRRGPYRRQK
jgi:transposase